MGDIKGLKVKHTTTDDAKWTFGYVAGGTMANCLASDNLFLCHEVHRDILVGGRDVLRWAQLRY
jgi:hypothetical protein